MIGRLGSVSERNAPDAAIAPADRTSLPESCPMSSPSQSRRLVGLLGLTFRTGRGGPDHAPDHGTPSSYLNIWLLPSPSSRLCVRRPAIGDDGRHELPRCHPPPVPRAATGPRRRDRGGWGLLFGALYFLQDGRSDRRTVGTTGSLAAQGWGKAGPADRLLLGAAGHPWTLKPLFGPALRPRPALRTRRKGYLILSGGATSLSLLGSAPSRPNLCDRRASLLAPGPDGRRGAGRRRDPTPMIDAAIHGGSPFSLSRVQVGCLYAGGSSRACWGGALSSSGASRGLSLPAASLPSALPLVCSPAFARAGPAGPGRGGRTTLSVLRARASGGGFGHRLRRVPVPLDLHNPSPMPLLTPMTRALASASGLRVTGGADGGVSIAASAAYGLYCRRCPCRSVHRLDRAGHVEARWVTNRGRSREPVGRAGDAGRRCRLHDGDPEASSTPRRGRRPKSRAPLRPCSGAGEPRRLVSTWIGGLL